MDYLFFLCSFIEMLGLYYAYCFIINVSISRRISVIIFQCAWIYVLSFFNCHTFHMSQDIFSLLCLWLGLHQWKGASLSDKIMHLLPFNVSMLHKPILSTCHEICVIEFDPMTGKSLQETVSSLYLCVLGGFLMHEGVQTLLLCDTMYVIKNWPFDPKIAPLYSLCIE